MLVVEILEIYILYMKRKKPSLIEIIKYYEILVIL